MTNHDIYHVGNQYKIFLNHINVIEAVSRLEKILRKEKNASEERMFEPMTQDELNTRINQSESDFQNN